MTETLFPTEKIPVYRLPNKETLFILLAYNPTGGLGYWKYHGMFSTQEKATEESKKLSHFWTCARILKVELP